MAIPRAFEELLEHSAPALHFPPHPGAKTAERVVPLRHMVNAPAKARKLAWLEKRMDACPIAQGQLLEFYSRWDGAGLFCLPHGWLGRYRAHFLIPPIADMQKLTARFEPRGKLRWMAEDLGEMYSAGSFVVIAGTPSEETHLTLLNTGRFEDQDLAGKVFYLSMDPMFGATKVVCGSFFEMLEALATGPVKFLTRLGSSFRLEAGGEMWGDVPDRYLPTYGIRPNQ
jgi:hypothetical protein